MRKQILSTIIIAAAMSFSFLSADDNFSVKAEENTTEISSEKAQEEETAEKSPENSTEKDTSEISAENSTEKDTSEISPKETTEKDTSEISPEETTEKDTTEISAENSTEKDTSEISPEETAEDILRGDVTNDGVINSNDIIAFIKVLLDENKDIPEETKKLYDLNENDSIEISDLTILKKYLSECIIYYPDLTDIETDNKYAVPAEAEEIEIQSISITEASLRAAAEKCDPFPVEVYIEDDKSNSVLNVCNDHSFSASVMSSKYENNSNRYATVFETWEDENTKEMWGKISLDRIEGAKWICMIRAEEDGSLKTLVRIPQRSTGYSIPEPDSYDYKVLVNAVYNEANGVNYRCDETTQLICKAAIVAEVLNRFESDVFPGTVDDVLKRGFSGASSYIGQNADSYYNRNKSRNPDIFEDVENSVNYFFEHQEDFGYYLYNHGLWRERHVNENYFSYDYHYYFDLTDPNNRDKFLYY